jgi:MFS family permease
VNTSYLRGIYLRLAGAVTLVVLLALAANALLSHRIFERALAPQMAAKVASVGGSIRALVFKAVEAGVDFKELYGVAQRFEDIKDEAPEITYAAITDTHGVVLHHSKGEPEGAVAYFASAPVLHLLRDPAAATPVVRVGGAYIVSVPIVSGEKSLGILHLGVNVRFVDDIVLDMLYDVLVVLVVTLFFTLELLHYIAGAKLEASLRDLGETFERGASGNFTRRRRTRGEQAFGSLVRLLDATLLRVNASYVALARDIESARQVPAHERPSGLSEARSSLRDLGKKLKFGIDDGDVRNDESQLARIRAPLFVFILAEELTRSFLPAYTRELLVDVPGLSPQLVIGLPIALFMLIVAISQPFFGVYCERKGHKHTMLMGAGIAAAGFMATAAAVSVLDLLLWRSLCAIGYAMVFVSAQAYVLDHATPATRARSFALFVGAIMAATVCGPSIGGILADNIGVRAAFVIAGMLAIGSLFVIRGLPDAKAAPEDRPAARVPRLKEIGALMLNARFMSVTGLAAMPAKILLTGVCFYLIPLYVLTIGSTQSMAGRILMTYAAVMVVMAPVTAGLANTRGRMHQLVAGGLVISGLGGMMLLAGPEVGWVFAAVILIGLGQSMSISAQSALVAEHCATEIAQLGEGVVYGVYRLLERIGNAIGPLLAAVLVVNFDYRTSFVAIGSAVAVCGAVFILATRRELKPVAVMPADAPLSVAQ